MSDIEIGYCVCGNALPCSCAKFGDEPPKCTWCYKRHTPRIDCETATSLIDRQKLEREAKRTGGEKCKPSVDPDADPSDALRNAAEYVFNEYEGMSLSEQVTLLDKGVGVSGLEHARNDHLARTLRDAGLCVRDDVGGNQLRGIAGNCIVHGCSNHMIQGRFIGDLCSPCYQYLSTGKIGQTDSFLTGLCVRAEVEAETIERCAGLCDDAALRATNGICEMAATAMGKAIRADGRTDGRSDKKGTEMTCPHQTIGVEFWREDGGYVVARCRDQDCLERGVLVRNRGAHLSDEQIARVAIIELVGHADDYYQDKRKCGLDSDGHADAWDSRWIYKRRVK